MTVTKRDVEVALADYKEIVSVTEEGTQIVVRLTEYIRDKSKWEAINNILHDDYNGNYIPKAQGGPEWRIKAGEKVEKETEKPQERTIEYYKKRLDGIFDELARLREEMNSEVQLKKEKGAS